MKERAIILKLKFVEFREHFRRMTADRKFLFTGDLFNSCSVKGCKQGSLINEVQPQPAFQVITTGNAHKCFFFSILRVFEQSVETEAARIPLASGCVTVTGIIHPHLWYSRLYGVKSAHKGRPRRPRRHQGVQELLWFISHGWGWGWIRFGLEW